MPSIRFDNPQALWLLSLLVPVVWLGLRSLAALEPERRYAAIALRAGVLVVLVLMLAGMQAVRRHSDLTVMAVIDQSESIRRFAPGSPAPGSNAPESSTAANSPGDQDTMAWLRDYLRAAIGGKRPDDRFGMIAYDARPSVTHLPATVPDVDPAITSEPVDGTDSASALRLALAMFPPDSGKRLIWASDGNETSGGGADQGNQQVLTIAREARAAGIPIDVLPIDYRLEGEVMVEGVYAPTESREGQTAAVRIVLRAARPTDGSLYLRHDDQTIDLAPDSPGQGAAIFVSDWTLEARDDDGAEAGGSPSPDEDGVAVGRYVLVRTLDLPMTTSGTNRFEAVFEPATQETGRAADVVAANNRAETFTLVHGRGRVLVFDGVGGDSGRILPRSLAAHELEVDVRPANAFPGAMSQLQRYDAVIFQNVPAEALTPAQTRMLARYVHDLGGGFVMLGGPDSFGAGGWTRTPVDDILPVECEIPSQTVLPSGALVIVLDRSGSMSSYVAGTKLTQQEVANEAAVYALSTLFPDDLVGVVAFDNSAKTVVPLTPNHSPQVIASQIRKIQPEGGTNIYAGLEAAYNELATVTPEQAAVRHIILLTDGHSQEGDAIALARKLVASGISLSTVGVGDGMNNQLLVQIAQMAGGQFYPISDPTKLPQIFVKEARTIRKNLIKEVPFVPQMVQTGSPIMASGLGEGVPRLKGFVLTGEKRKLGVFQPIVGPEGEPIFAHWQVGLGRSAAFTSDATNRWASDWLSWPGYGDFWARTLRAIARPSSSTDYDLVAVVEGDRLQVRLDVAGHEGHRGFLDVRGSLLQPDGRTTPITLTQVGPGLYEADTDAADAGSYIVSLFVNDTHSGERRAVFGGTSKPPGAELRRFRSNRALLEEVARITGGRVLDPRRPAEMNLYARDVPFESRSVRPLWRPLLWTLLVLFLLDVACRRIAWDLAAIARWGSGVWGSLSSRRESAREAAATLGSLRHSAAQRRTPSTEPPPAPPASRAAVRTRKFEAAPDAKASDDFAAAVGAATATEARPPRDDDDATPPPESQGPTTSRLLAAKRRAAQRLEEDRA